MDKYLSKKEYLKKYDSNVGYALYVEDNIKRNDYARLNTGKIVRVIGIKENKLNKKAIYYGVYEQDWFDSMAVENFSDKPIDLVEVGDYVNGYRVEQVSIETNEVLLDHNGFGWRAVKDGDKIVTHEQMASIEYKVEEDR